VHEWRPEVVVDAGWARRLIGTQFPELELGSLRLLGEGWDNTVWLVDERWVFRFPRRAVAIPGFERELAVLPRLAERLPLPVPVPAFRGRPAEGFPWPFTGGPLVPGQAVAVADLTDADRVREARPLGRFLRALHALGPADVVDDPSLLAADPTRRADMAMRTRRTVDRLAEADRLGIWHAPIGVGEMLAGARSLPPPDDPGTLAHGDLHILHLLAGVDGRLSGVIDWGDVCRGDPGIDLGVYWSFVPPDGREGFVAEYGPIDPAALLRARVLAVFLSATLAVYAREQGHAALERGAVSALDRSMAG
jgi:aminoglycoside phosphotransferase (APT) family kinase protein